MSVLSKDERDTLDQFTKKWGPVLGGDNSSRSHIDVNAGGVGVWIAATACIVMLGCFFLGAVLGGLWLSRELTRIDERAAEQEVKIDRANTFLSAIWAQAPELEAKLKSQQESRGAQR